MCMANSETNDCSQCKIECPYIDDQDRKTPWFVCASCGENYPDDFDDDDDIRFCKFCGGKENG